MVIGAPQSGTAHVYAEMAAQVWARLQQPARSP